METKLVLKIPNETFLRITRYLRQSHSSHTNSSNSQARAKFFARTFECSLAKPWFGHNWKLIKLEDLFSVFMFYRVYHDPPLAQCVSQSIDQSRSVVWFMNVHRLFNHIFHCLFQLSQSPLSNSNENKYLYLNLLFCLLASLKPYTFNSMCWASFTYSGHCVACFRK